MRPWTNIVVGLVSLLAGCGSAAPYGGVSKLAPTPGPSQPAMPLAPQAGPVVVFTSDTAVVLSKSTDTYQFAAATAPAGPGAITWSSSNLAVATIGPNGIAHVTGTIGSSTITASAGGAVTAYGTVSFVHPLPNTVIVPSSAFVAQTSSQVILQSTPTTRTLAVGEILASQGDKAGVLAYVTSISSSGNQVALGITHATLDAAFDKFDFEVNVPLPELDSSVVQASFRHDRRVVAASDSGEDPVDFSCSINAGKQFDLEANGQSFTWRFVANLVGHVKPNDFALGIDGEIDATAHLGVLNVQSSMFGQGGNAVCEVALPPYALPIYVPITPYLELQPSITPKVGVELAVTFGGSTASLVGPDVSESSGFQAGVTYDGSWHATAAASPAPQVQFTYPTPPPIAQVPYSAAFGPYVEADFGIAAVPPLCTVFLSLPKCTIVGVDFLYGQVGNDLTLKIPSFDASSASYTGPVWEDAYHLKLGLQPTLTGGIGTLAKWLLKGAGSVNVFPSLTLYDHEFPPLFEQPQIALNLTSSGPSLTATTLVDNAQDPIRLGGEPVKFGVVTGAAVQSVGTETLPTSGQLTVRATFTPPPDSGSHPTVTADVYDAFFGGLGLPYRSASAQVVAQSPTPAPTSTPTPAPKPTPSSVPTPNPDDDWGVSSNALSQAGDTAVYRYALCDGGILYVAPKEPQFPDCLSVGAILPSVIPILRGTATFADSHSDTKSPCNDVYSVATCSSSIAMSPTLSSLRVDATVSVSPSSQNDPDATEQILSVASSSLDTMRVTSATLPFNTPVTVQEEITVGGAFSIPCSLAGLPDFADNGYDVADPLGANYPGTQPSLAGGCVNGSFTQRSTGPSPTTLTVQHTVYVGHGYSVSRGVILIVAVDDAGTGKAGAPLLQTNSSSMKGFVTTFHISAVTMGVTLTFDSGQTYH